MFHVKLGIPTANIAADDLSENYPDLATGVYYGVVALDPTKIQHENGPADAANEKTSSTVLPAVLSIGYNPFYKNTERSVVCPDCSLSYSYRRRKHTDDSTFWSTGNSYHATSHSAIPNRRRTAPVQPPARFLRYKTQSADSGVYSPRIRLCIYGGLD